MKDEENLKEAYESIKASKNWIVISEELTTEEKKEFGSVAMQHMCVRSHMDLNEREIFSFLTCIKQMEHILFEDLKRRNGFVIAIKKSEEVKE
jgi:hypothetical protein